MPEPSLVDVAVIGLGSGGENLAIRLAEAGLTVVGFEPALVGGECPFLACIPSKVLLHHVGRGSEWEVARAHRERATDERDDSEHLAGLLDAGVEVVRARASLVGERLVEADSRRWRADHVVLATGSDAAMPDLGGLDRSLSWTSDDAMQADQLPDSLVILGGGAIGCELAVVHAHFGSRTVLVHRSPHLGGDDLDPEVAELLANDLRGRGVQLHLDARSKTVEHLDDRGRVRLEGDGFDDIEADRLLVAIGQEPNWAGLGLDAMGVEPEVDDELRVGSIDWLWAVGDVNGLAPWTHGANHQAHWLADHLTGRSWGRPPDAEVAHSIFTQPPVAAVGRSHRQATADGIDAVTGRVGYDAIARTTTDELGDGTVVVVADRATRRLIGCSGIGDRFDDVISTFSVMLHQQMTVDDAARFVIPFPTVTQVLTPAIEDAASRM